MAMVERIVTEPVGRGRTGLRPKVPAAPISAEPARAARDAGAEGAPEDGALETVVFAPGETGAPTAAWQALADRALEPNPFFRPDFLAAAAAVPGVVAASTRVVALRRREDGALLALAPVARGRAGLVPGATLVQAGMFGPLGTPLLAPEAGPDVLPRLIAAMIDSGPGLLALPHLRLDGPVAARLRAGAAEGRFALALACEAHRAGFSGGAPGAAQFAAVTSHRRKRLQRLLRRLGERGRVEIVRCGPGADQEAAVEAFLRLEASGWKGRAGTALGVEAGRADFARAFLRAMARDGRLVIDMLRLDGAPVAMLVLLRDGDRLFSWKIAHDEAFSAFSPGAQIARQSMRLTLEAADGIADADSLALPDHTMISPLWRGEVPVATALVGSGHAAGALLALARASLAGEAGLRAVARRLRARLRRAL